MGNYCAMKRKLERNVTYVYMTNKKVIYFESFNNELFDCNILDFLNEKQLFCDFVDLCDIILCNISIPEDIIILILSFLNLQEIINLSNINKSFKYYWINHPKLFESLIEQFAKNKIINIVNKNSKLTSQISQHTICCKKGLNSMNDFYEYIYKPNLILSECFEFVKPKNHYNTHIIISVFGKQNVGKSTWLQSWAKQEYVDNITPTIGVELIGKSLNYRSNNTVWSRAWDISGNPTFSTFCSGYFREAFAFGCGIFCFDLSDGKSFDEIENYLQKFTGYNNFFNLNNILLENKTPLAIVGLKSEKERNVSDDKIKTMLRKFIPESIPFKKLCIQYFEVSAKENINVNTPIFWVTLKHIKLNGY
ncbi:hypothetical protein ABK040_000674 [Willaertia magna]